MTFSIQDRIFAQANGPLADRLQHRGLRRLIVALTLASALGVAIALYRAGDQILWMLAATLPFWACAFLLNLSLRGIFELGDSHLDEHQVAVRNAAYKRAYGCTLVFLVLVVTTAAAIDAGRIGTFAVAAFAFLTSALAPRLIAAWVMDASDDEE